MATIRGLINFIGDIRNCKTEEEERERVETELAKIRAQFAKPNVGGYAKKKYMWKIMYMYILGYPVDFGHMQCVDLIRSDTWSEKNVGYVGVSLLLIEHTDMLRLCINTIKQDLKAKNEMFQCLALTCVANVGGPEFAEALKNDVEDLLLSGTTRFFVRKKSALCLLRLLRQNPDNLPSIERAPKIIKIATQSNIGVVTSVMSLLTGLSTFDSENYGGVVDVAINLLEQYVVMRECAKEYIYYRTPCPWLQVKLLRVLQFYPPPKDKSKVDKLYEILERIVTKTEVTSNVNKNHADHSILFEAMNVIIHLNLHDQAMLHDRAINKLLHFINVKEGNIRYLGLDAMTRLAKIGKTHTKIKSHLRTIRYSLDDNDISIRRRALDLLYGICDEDNVQEIIDHLLRYLNKAEYDMREDMVLKIAVLAEKYATDLQWYINVVLQLLTMAGDFVTEDVWHRVIQIVTNNEHLQKYSVQKVLESLNVPPVHESTIKVAGYILGEFGHMLESVSGKEQFEALHKHFQSSTVGTKALLLSTYMKFINLYEDLQPKIIKIFNDFKAAVDPELQQRAVEYGVMANYPNQELISQVWEAMPDFPQRESNLMKLVKRKAGRNENDPFSDGGAALDKKDDDSDEDSSDEDEDDDEDEDEDEDEEEDTTKKAKVTKKEVSSNNNLSQAQQKKQEAPQEDLLGDLFGGGGAGAGGDIGASNSSNVKELVCEASLIMKSFFTLNCVLYDDQTLLRFGIKTVIEPGKGLMKILLVYGNRTQNDITNVNVEIENKTTLKGIDIQFANNNFTVSGLQEYQQRCRASLISPNNEIPRLSITFAHNNTQYKLKVIMPVVATKFFKEHQMDASTFKNQWNSNNQQAQAIINVNDNIKQGGLSLIQNIITKGMKMAVVQNIEKNPNNTVGVAVCSFAKTKPDGSNVTMGILLRAEYNSNMEQIRITVRSKHALTSQCVLLACQEIFGNSN